MQLSNGVFSGYKEFFFMFYTSMVELHAVVRAELERERAPLLVLAERVHRRPRHARDPSSAAGWEWTLCPRRALRNRTAPPGESIVAVARDWAGAKEWEREAEPDCKPVQTRAVGSWDAEASRIHA